MKYNYSVIIPHKESLDTLERLLKSIPNRHDIEIIVVDNSAKGIKRADVKSNKEITILHCNPERFAGGARNIGIDYATGKWLLFADADDYFTDISFDIFDKYVNSCYDLIYYHCDSVYDDTLQPAERHIEINKLLQDYSESRIPEIECRLYMVVPWAKMILKSLVVENQIKFDEVVAANDIIFSTRVGYYAKKFHVEKSQVYVVTIRKGSLSNKWNNDILYSRFMTGLKRNLFLREHNLSEYQISVMVYLYRAIQLSPKVLFKFIVEAIKYRQNIFIGIHNWINTFRRISIMNKKNQEYIVNDKS